MDEHAAVSVCALQVREHVWKHTTVCTWNSLCFNVNCVRCVLMKKLNTLCNALLFFVITCLYLIWLIIHTLVFLKLSSEQCSIVIKYAFVCHTQFISYTSKLNINCYVATDLSTFKRKSKKQQLFSYRLESLQLSSWHTVMCCIVGLPSWAYNTAVRASHCWEPSLATAFGTVPPTCVL